MTGLENEEDDNLFEQLGISRPSDSEVSSSADAGADTTDPDSEASDDVMSEIDGDKKPEGLAASVVEAVVVESAVPVPVEVPAGGVGKGEDVGVDIGVDVGEDVEAHAITVAAAEAAVEAHGKEDEEKATALAAAAALEAAVASGDVVYPDPEASSVGEGLHDGVESGEGQVEEVGEELAASVGPAETLS